MLYRSFHNLLFPANLKREGEVIPMNHVENKKKLNNKGFSLVELIIVIAIMAVLIGVLAPQYLRYVEKSRYQTDATMVDNVKNAIQIAISTDETIYSAIVTDAGTTITWDTTTFQVILPTAGDLDKEVTKTINVSETTLTSKAMRGDVPEIVIDKNGDVTVNLATAP